MKGYGEYPPNWKAIAKRIKDDAHWRCERCKKRHQPSIPGQCLTVHHLVPDKALCEPWNLTALCARCHLHIQAKVKMDQTYFLPHSEWFIPHLRGYVEWVGRQDDQTARDTWEPLGRRRKVLNVMDTAG